jgi:phage I-like protein
VDYAQEAGVVATVSWTDTAAGLIATKQYRGFSPSFYAKKVADAVFNLTRIIGGSLVNRPAFLNLWLAKEAETEFVYTEKEKAQMDILQQLREKLSLAAEADEATVFAALEAVLAQATQFQSVLASVAEGELTVQEAKFVASTKFSAVEQQVADLTGQLETATARLSELDGQVATATAEIAAYRAAEQVRVVEEAVERAMTAGVFTDATRDAAVEMATASLTAFNAFVEKASPVIVAGALLRKPADGQDSHGLSDAELQRCETLNIDPAVYAAERQRAEQMFNK